MLSQIEERIKRFFRRRIRRQETPQWKATELALGFILGEREADVSSIEQCSLSDYRQIVATLPRPSNEQINNYVRFVSEAHSWYKLLPLLPPSEVFQFFVDPFSGYDRVLQPGGGVIHKERTENSEPFHYTWMTTRDYRSRFGYLSYKNSYGLLFHELSWGGKVEYAEFPIFSTSEGPYRIPSELARVGSVEVTALIHRLAARVWVWREFLPRLRPKRADESTRKWPTETGGNETLRKIIDVCNQRIREGSRRESDAELVRRIREGSRPESDPELESLLLPERQRLQSNMTEAINRVLDLVCQDDN